MNAHDVLYYGNQTVLRTVRGLSAPDWETAGVCGWWSVKEIIAHLASFEHMLADVFAMVNGDPPGPTLVEWMSDGQGFNDRQVPARAALSPAQVLAEYEQTVARNLASAAALPQEAFRTIGFFPAYGAEYDFEDFIAYTFYGHKREHSAQIAVFRDRIGH